MTDVQLVAITMLGLCGFFCVPVGSHRSRGLTFTFACVLVRARVVGPGSPPTNTKEPHVVQPVRSRPFLALFSPQVCHRQETGLSPLARTCCWTWSFLRRLRDSAHRFHLRDRSHHEPQFKNWRWLPLREGCSRYVRHRVFNARRARDASFRVMKTN